MLDDDDSWIAVVCGMKQVLLTLRRLDEAKIDTAARCVTDAQAVWIVMVFFVVLAGLSVQFSDL